jgi:hypothetical protein
MNMDHHRQSQCCWPNLSDPYDTALREAVAFVFGETEPVGIIATGTIIRGEAHATSDLDIYVLHRAPYRRRVQRFSNGVPTEIFINPPHTVRQYFVEEHHDGRLITAHMLATGVVVFEDDPVVAQLRAESREWLKRPIALSPDRALSARYAAATRLEDGADIAATDPRGATMLLTQAVASMLEFWFLASGERIPRSKKLLSTAAVRDPTLGSLIDQFFAATHVAQRVEAAEAIGDHTIGARGFFAWDSGPAAVVPPLIPPDA